MIPVTTRDEPRNNISHLKNKFEIWFAKDVTDSMLPIVEDIVQRGLRFVKDRVIFNYDLDQNFTDFYPLDVDLTNEDMKSLNKYLLGYMDVSKTVIAEMAELIANDILRRINKELDKNPNYVRITFAPSSVVKYENTLAKMVYAFVRRREEGGYVLEVDTAFKIEGVYSVQ